MTITPDTQHTLRLTMVTVAVHLDVTRLDGGFHFTITNPEQTSTHVPDATALADWLEDEDTNHEGTRDYPGTMYPVNRLTVRKRFHSMTLEELVEVSVISSGHGAGGMIILNYPQTRELAAFLQS